MAKRTKAMIEADNEYLMTAYKKLEQETKVLRTENKSLLNVIQIYGGMKSFTIANERIADALAHTVSTLERRIERGGR